MSLGVKAFPFGEQGTEFCALRRPMSLGVEASPFGEQDSEVCALMRPRSLGVKALGLGELGSELCALLRPVFIRIANLEASYPSTGRLDAFPLIILLSFSSCESSDE